jgi:hypothetical protein
VTEADLFRWVTEFSNWGKWGPDDGKGQSNYITPAKRVQAAGLVKLGITVSMGHNVLMSTDAGATGSVMVRTMTVIGPTNTQDQYAYTGSYHGNNHSHWDALCHYYGLPLNGKFYNNNSVIDICDIDSGTSDDCDSNGVPDECQFNGVFTLISADFENGAIPAGWSETGLWHNSTSCPRSNTCNPTHWAYYGIDAACNFFTGARTLGSMTPPPIAVNPNTSSLILTYCSAYSGNGGNSNTSGRDWAWVSVNGVEVDDVSRDGLQPTWETRTVNLSAYAGQTITIAWNFDSRNAITTSLLGWQVDQIALTAVVTNSNDCNHNLTLDACEIAQGTAGDCNSNGTLDECEASPVVCPCNTVLGDVDGNSIVNGLDIDNFVGCFLLGPGVLPACGCADLDQNGLLNQLDVDLLAKCLVGAGCP